MKCIVLLDRRLSERGLRDYDEASVPGVDEAVVWGKDWSVGVLVSVSDKEKANPGES